MSSDPFPALTDANRLFARNGEINAALPFARLKRFSACLSDPEGQVAVNLSFELDAEGRRRLSGSLDAVATQICQRCLQPLPVSLHCSLELLILDSEAELKQLPQAEVLALDAIVDEGEGPDVLAIIEDELILSLPLVPVHDNENCNAALNALKHEAAGEAEKQDSKGSQGKTGVKSAGKDVKGVKENPFAILAALKQDTDNNGNGMH